MTEICVLAFDEPPASWGFRPSRSGTSWFIRLHPSRVEKCLAALKARGIEAKTIADTPRPYHRQPTQAEEYKRRREFARQANQQQARDENAHIQDVLRRSHGTSAG